MVVEAKTDHQYTMKVERISRKFIKPASPTPQNLKNLNLSILDKCLPPIKFGVVLFYESKPGNKSELEESLKEVLVHFYPLAGRHTINDPVVDCSDQGAVFVEAKALDTELTMDQLVLNKMEIQTVDQFLPDECIQADAPNPLLWIQVTHFPSGGLAIGVAVTHSFFDSFSLGVFIAAWSKATMNPGRINEITPSFDLPSLLPCKDHDFEIAINEITDQGESFVVKRLVFGKEAITSLRSKLSLNQDGKTISRVRIVSAVLVKALIGLECGKHGRRRDLVVSLPINMRERTNTPLQNPKHACGNLAVISLTRSIAAAEAKEMGLQELVNLFGDAIGEAIANHAELLSPNQEGCDIIISDFKSFLTLMGTPNTSIITITDWSKFGFYEADFGFGKPVWTSSGQQSLSVTTIVLMNNKEGDGIEAWLHLNKNDMLFFEQDEEIKSFTI